MGSASARQHIDGHDCATQRAALITCAGDTTAKAGGNLRDQLGLDTLRFGNCQKDAFRSVEAARAEKFSCSLGSVVAHLFLH